MESSENFLACLNCGRLETEIPLVTLRHNGAQAWICSQCLPILIHHPERLSGKLKSVEDIAPVPPDGS